MTATQSNHHGGFLSASDAYAASADFRGGSLPKREAWSADVRLSSLTTTTLLFTEAPVVLR
jgi:hypothetical protein